MPETAKQVVKTRTSSHSDVADSTAAREHQAQNTERLFADALLRRVREIKGELLIRNFQEEWLNTDDGLVHELCAEVAPVES